MTDIPSIAIPTLVPPRTPFLTWKKRKILNSRELGDMLSFPGRYIIAASGSNPINCNHSVYFLSYWVAHKVCTLYPFFISFAHKLDSPHNLHLQCELRPCPDLLVGRPLVLDRWLYIEGHCVTGAVLTHDVMYTGFYF